MPDKTVREYAIPMLPSHSISETLEFYTALGFIVTYEQKAPNMYICLKIKNIELHFFGLKQLKPENNFSTCYLIVDKIDDLYTSFKQGLKAKLGKVPAKGYPRINMIKDMPVYGVRQFVVVDPSGNYIRIGQPILKEKSLLFEENGVKPAKGTPLQNAYELGKRLAYGQDDLAKAAKVLDKAITADDSDPIDLFRVISLRLDIANNQEDAKAIKNFITKGKALLKKIPDTSLIADDLASFKQIVSEQN